MNLVQNIHSCLNMLNLGLECLCGISEVPVTDPYNIQKLEKDNCEVKLWLYQEYRHMTRQ